MTGLYRSQLPAAMAEDDFTSRFTRIFEDIGEPIYQLPTSFPAVFDPQLASADMARWLGGWIGVAVDEVLDVDRRRSVVHAGAIHFSHRGSAAALTALLEAATGGTVSVVDPGGISRERSSSPGPILPQTAQTRPAATGEATPVATPPARIRLSTTGTLDLTRIRQIISDEIPAWLAFDVEVAEADDRGDDGGDAPADAGRED